MKETRQISYGEFLVRPGLHAPSRGRASLLTSACGLSTAPSPQRRQSMKRETESTAWKSDKNDLNRLIEVHLSSDDLHRWCGPWMLCDEHGILPHLAQNT